MTPKKKRILITVCVLWIGLLLLPVFWWDILENQFIHGFYKVYGLITLILLSSIPAGLVAAILGAKMWCIGRSKLGRFAFWLFATPYDPDEFATLTKHKHFEALFSAGLFLGVWFTLIWYDVKLLFPRVMEWITTWLTHSQYMD